MSKRKQSSIDIIAAIRHRQLFGSLQAFQNMASWAGWFAWLKAVFCLPMDDGELAIYRQCTGRTDPPKSEPSEAYTIVGRRGGKSFISALTAVYVACFREYKQHLNAGETAVVLVLARDRDQAKIVFRYIKGILGSVPPLAAMIVNEKADEIELENQVTIMVKTSDFRAVRGLTIALCIADEVAFWDNQGLNPDREIFTALRPAMATIPGSKLLCISTAYAKAGVLYEAYRDYHGQDSGHALVWATDTRTMNPTISEDLINRELEKDPDSAKAEWLGMFREDLESAFTLEAIEACVVSGRDELPASSLIAYKAFVDPSGGKKDAFTLGIGHKEDGRAVLDCLKVWPAPFDPAVVVDEAAEVLKRYGCVSVTGDNYAGEWPVSYFRQRGVDYQKSEKAKSELYLAMIPTVNGKQIELPDLRQLVEELRRLERRRGRTGKDTIDHPANGHDDVANSAAGVCWLILNDIEEQSLGGFHPSRHVSQEPFRIDGPVYVGLTLAEPFAAALAQTSRSGSVQFVHALASPSLHSLLRDLRDWLARNSKRPVFTGNRERFGIYNETEAWGLIDQLETAMPGFWQMAYTDEDTRRQRMLQAFDEYTMLGQPKVQISTGVRLLPEALARRHDKGTTLAAVANAAALIIDKLAPGTPERPRQMETIIADTYFDPRLPSWRWGKDSAR